MDANQRRQATPHHGIPMSLTTFVGRRQEIDELIEMLSTGRLVTLVGPPGVGKTRLALAVADALQGQFRQGIWLVELAGLAEPALVPRAIASGFGLGDHPGRSTTTALLDTLRDWDVLLVIDNCEHLIDACAALAAEILGSCPGVRILATSREGIRIGGETIVRVPALSMPPSWNEDDPGDEALASLSDFEAVRLFVDRGRAASPRFALTRQNAAAVARIGRRLDGLPLAIELAAARISGLTAPQIADRLDASFRLLTSGSRTALPRQQTLRGAIDWSYNLLSEPERVLLRRLAVFAGGWPLEAAEFVADPWHQVPDPGADAAGHADMRDPSAEVLSLLLGLVDKSLVQVEGDAGPEPRYRLLETVRQYGAEKLAEHGDGNLVRRRHRDWFLALAARGAKSTRRPDAREWYDRLDSEHDNLRAALAWSLHGHDPGDSEIALRLVLAMEWFWFARDHLSEGRWWMERALEADARLGDAGTSSTSTTVARADCSPSAERQRPVSEYGWHPRVAGLIQVSILAYMQQDRDTQHDHLSEALELGERVGDTLGLAHAHVALGNQHRAEGMYKRSAELLSESLRMFRSLGDDFGVWRGLSNLSETLTMLGDITQARDHADAARLLAISNDQPWGIAQAYRLRGLTAFQAGDLEQAETDLDEAISRWRALAVTRGPHWALCERGSVLLAREEPARAAASFRESLDISHRAGDRRCVARNLEGLAATSLALESRGHDDIGLQAARLLGAAAAIRDAIQTPVSPLDRRTYDRAVRSARDRLDDAAFEFAHDEGRALTQEQAVALACGEPAQAGMGVASVRGGASDSGGGEAASLTPPADGGGLTHREQEVAALVGAGLTNREIAAKLVISERTAEGHVARIMARLGFNRRAQVAVWAVQQGLEVPR